MTATAIQTKKYTLEEYFELEYQSSDKHEYLNGKIRNMTYTAKPHGKIVTNLLTALNNFLENTDLEVYAGDRMIYVPDCGKVYYPDLVVLPLEVETYAYRGKMEADLYPIAIIEILSDSTEENDYEYKWICYQKISTLREYMLVSQKYPFVQIYRRESAKDNWIYSTADENEANVTFTGLNITLKDIYKRVTFPPAPNDETL